MADAPWRDRYARYLDRERERREQREQARRDYLEALSDDCAHGPRVRKLGEQDGRPFGMLVCRLDSPNCGVKNVPAAEVFRQWKEAQPDNPAGA
jgi:hypothetical protein